MVEAGNPNRKTFRETKTMLEWLTEVLNTRVQAL